MPRRNHSKRKRKHVPPVLLKKGAKRQRYGGGEQPDLRFQEAERRFRDAEDGAAA
jgi:hypothetical protein